MERTLLETVVRLDRLIELAREKQEMFKYVKNVALVKYKKDEGNYCIEEREKMERILLEIIMILDRLIELAKEKQEIFKYIKNMVLAKYTKYESRTTKKHTKQKEKYGINTKNANRIRDADGLVV